MIQARVDASGSGLGVFVLIDENEELIALFGHKRLREYPIGGGADRKFKAPSWVR